MYLIGGFEDASNSSSQFIQIYDATNDIWSKGAKSPVNKTVFDDPIFAIAGAAGTASGGG